MPNKKRNKRRTCFLSGKLGILARSDGYMPCNHETEKAREWFPGGEFAKTEKERGKKM